MKSFTVVKLLNIFEYILLSLNLGLIALMMNPFCFQGMKELSETALTFSNCLCGSYVLHFYTIWTKGGLV